MTPTEARRLAIQADMSSWNRQYGISDALRSLADQLDAVSDALDYLQGLTPAQAQALRKDAERYRWIRTAGAWESEVGMDILSEDPAQFDAAVDIRMEET